MKGRGYRKRKGTSWNTDLVCPFIFWYLIADNGFIADIPTVFFLLIAYRQVVVLHGTYCCCEPAPKMNGSSLTLHGLPSGFSQRHFFKIPDIIPLSIGGASLMRLVTEDNAVSWRDEKCSRLFGVGAILRCFASALNFGQRNP
jgi:hypothetical protein